MRKFLTGANVMLHIRIPSRLMGALAIHQKWFAHKPEIADCLRFAHYFYCQHREEVFGFRRKPRFTMLVDLTASEKAILDAFSETTRYEVNRSNRENVRAELETDIERFCSFFNAAADAKGRDHLDPISIATYGKNMCVTKAITENEVLAMHSYLFDEQIGRVALYHSASLFRLEKNSQQRNRIGRANRWLHFQDMVRFKRLGASLYDFGGYAKGTSVHELQRINEFKEGFGGSIVEESNYVSNIATWWNQIRGGSGTI
jgi:hypothetical protein